MVRSIYLYIQYSRIIYPVRFLGYKGVVLRRTISIAYSIISKKKAFDFFLEDGS